MMKPIEVKKKNRNNNSTMINSIQLTIDNCELQTQVKYFIHK